MVLVASGIVHRFPCWPHGISNSPDTTRAKKEEEKQMTTNNDDVDLLLQEIMGTIDRCGWAIIGTAKEDGTPFSYTAGLTFLRVPELYIENQDYMIAGRILNKLASRQKEAGAFDKDQVTQVDEYEVKLVDRESVAGMNVVKGLFGDNDPVPPTALTVVVK